MIKHVMNGPWHEVTPLTEKAALFLNTFVGRKLRLTQQEWRSVQLEMGAHQCWVWEVANA